LPWGARGQATGAHLDFGLTPNQDGLILRMGLQKSLFRFEHYPFVGQWFRVSNFAQSSPQDRAFMN
jgi:hypothetical protein